MFVPSNSRYHIIRIPKIH